MLKYRLYTLHILVGAVVLLAACSLPAKRQAEDRRDSYRFKTEVLLGYTPVKDQGRSPLCWAYSMLATIETEHIMLGDSVNLSVDYVARNLLVEQARRHFLSGGKTKMTMRGTMPLLLRLLNEYGAMPYDSYNNPKLNYNTLAKRLATLSNGSPNMSMLEERANRVLDDHIGALPPHVFMLGAEYTPQEFAHSVCMRNEYMAMTSFTHHPFDEMSVLEIPDNYSNEPFYNVPIDVLMNRIERSIKAGHPVCWEGDVSEPGFSFKRGVAVLDNEQPCTQWQRQWAFEARRTTDDHCMALIGLARDKHGRRFYIAKNSWGTNNPYGGLMYLSENYVRMKTIAVVVKNM